MIHLNFVRLQTRQVRHPLPPVVVECTAFARSSRPGASLTPLRLPVRVAPSSRRRLAGRRRVAVLLMRRRAARTQRNISTLQFRNYNPPRYRQQIEN